MGDYSTLLRQGAKEAREYKNASPDAKAFHPSWLESLANRMEKASSITNTVTVESEIEAIARSIIDSGPMGSDFAPSFSTALDAVQRSRKKRNASVR